MTYESVIESQAGVLPGAPVSALKRKKGYQVLPFSMNRRMVAASASVAREQNNIQGLIEVDISEPRRLIREHRQRTGERLSLTAYVTICLTMTFNHDIVDGAPAARFLKRFSELLKNGELLRDEINHQAIL